MTNYAVRRLLLAVPVVLVISILVFWSLYLVPGDPALVLLGATHGGMAITPEVIKEAREKYGLNDPLYVQYVRWLRNIARGDMGTSLRTKRPVLSMIREQLPSTLELATVGMAIGTFVGLTLGIIAALKRDTWIDSVSMLTALVGVSMPPFWFGFILIFIFALTLGWFPATGYGGLKRLVLPAITLGFALSAVVARLVRANVIEVLTQDYIRTARAKGLVERVILHRHVIKNVMIPVITILGVQFGNLLSGTVIIEAVFARQGIGRLLVDSILDKDFPVVQGLVLIWSTGYIITNVLVDLSYTVFDPRIRYE
ncbi:MAG: ABC transporter permease [Anaerolineae bacterium]|nr:ABC transporter permease [Anaerolineae bacterium]